MELIPNDIDSLLVPTDSTDNPYSIDSTDSEFIIMSVLIDHLGYTSTAETLVVRDSTWMMVIGGGMVDSTGSRAWWACQTLINIGGNCDSTAVDDFVRRNLTAMSVRDSITVGAPVYYGNPVATNYDSVYAIHPGYSRIVLSFSRVGFSKDHLRALIHLDSHVRYDAVGRFYFLEQKEGSWKVVSTLSNYLS
jgi:hypothetical protein